MVGVFPKSIQSIIAFDRQEKDAVFRKSWSWKDCLLQCVFLIVIITVVFIIGPSYRLLNVPFWMYGAFLIVPTIVDIIFDIVVRRKAAKKEEELIGYIIGNNPEEDQIYSPHELRDRMMYRARNTQVEPEEV